MRRASALVFAALLMTACGGSSPPSETPPTTVAELPYSAPTLQGEIPREALTDVLERGLGFFLQGIVTEPHVEDGRFVGHRVIEMYPDDPRFSDLAIQPGDTVTSVNGKPIERPDEAYEVWTSLRVSSELLISYLHDGQPQTLRFGIVD
jgi:S1-C subfamily serine protease